MKLRNMMFALAATTALSVPALAGPYLDEPAPKLVSYEVSASEYEMKLDALKVSAYNPTLKDLVWGPRLPFMMEDIEGALTAIEFAKPLPVVSVDVDVTEFEMEEEKPLPVISLDVEVAEFEMEEANIPEASQLRVGKVFEAIAEGEFQKQLRIEASSEIGSGDQNVSAGLNLQTDRYDGFEVHAGPSVGTHGADLTVGATYQDPDFNAYLTAGIGTDNGVGARAGASVDIIEDKTGGFAIGAGAEISDSGFDFGPNIEVFSENLGVRVSATDVRVVERDPVTNERKRYSVNPILVGINELFGARSALDVVVCAGEKDCEGVPLGIFSFITKWISDALATQDVELKIGQSTTFELPHGLIFDAERSVVRAPNGAEVKVVLNVLETTSEVAKELDAALPEANLLPLFEVPEKRSEPIKRIEQKANVSLLIFEDGTAFTVSGKALTKEQVDRALALHEALNPNAPKLVIVEPTPAERTVPVNQQINKEEIRVNEAGPSAPVSLERGQELVDELELQDGIKSPFAN